MEFERAFWPHDRQHVFLEAACGHAAGLLFNYVPATGRPVLVAMPVVESATWVGQADEAELRRFYTEHLRRAFGRKATAPVRVLKTDWGGDLFSGMSYSYIRVGSGKAVMEALGAPEGRVHFAGEATAGNAHGTVHGAIASGIRAAEEVS